MIARVRWWEVSAALGLFLFLFGILCVPVYVGSGPRSMKSLCLSNVKQMGTALMMYAGDADDRLPMRDHWMDSTLSYTKTEGDWHCPSMPKGSYGYAFNADLSGLKEAKIADPLSTLQVYDSVDPIRNASDRLASLPDPGRHHGFDAVGYADGHAKMRMP